MIDYTARLIVSLLGSLLGIWASCVRRSVEVSVTQPQRARHASQQGVVVGVTNSVQPCVSMDPRLVLQLFDSRLAQLNPEAPPDGGRRQGGVRGSVGRSAATGGLKCEMQRLVKPF